MKPGTKPKTPKGLRNSAQGCAPEPRQSGSDRATLGSTPSTRTNPERVASFPCCRLCGTTRSLAALETGLCITCRKKPARVCTQCGCTDHRACPGGCIWIIEHPATNTRICSNCDRAALDAMITAINESETPIVLTPLGEKMARAGLKPSDLPIITGQGRCITDDV